MEKNSRLNVTDAARELIDKLNQFLSFQSGCFFIGKYRVDYDHLHVFFEHVDTKTEIILSHDHVKEFIERITPILK